MASGTTFVLGGCFVRPFICVCIIRRSSEAAFFFWFQTVPYGMPSSVGWFRLPFGHGTISSPNAHTHIFSNTENRPVRKSHHVTYQWRFEFDGSVLYIDILSSDQG